MSKNLMIIGAGMAGLLAANLLRHRNPIVLESQPHLPNNHSAVLRFRSPEIGELLHIPFRKVKMIKGSLPWLNPVADALAYSRKVTGVARSDRSITDLSTETHDRWIAPPDFIERMAKDLEVRINVHDAFDWAEGAKVLSTIPMPGLLKILKYEREIKFESVVGFNARAKLRNVDAYVSLYIPNPDLPFNRVSITGDELIVEFALPNASTDQAFGIIADKNYVMSNVIMAMNLLGLNDLMPMQVEAKVQRYSKILPINEEERRRAIYWASTITGRAWQLGRYSTWRPGLMMDDLIKDIRLLDKWMEEGDSANYSMQQHDRRRA